MYIRTCVLYLTRYSVRARTHSLASSWRAPPRVQRSTDSFLSLAACLRSAIQCIRGARSSHGRAIKSTLASDLVNMESFMVAQSSHPLPLPSRFHFHRTSTSIGLPLSLFLCALFSALGQSVGTIDCILRMRRGDQLKMAVVLL